MLTPSNVNVFSFGKVGFLRRGREGRCAAAVSLGGADTRPGPAQRRLRRDRTRQPVRVRCRHRRVLWRTSLLGPGETPSDARSCGQVTPEIGITATPVIDRRADRTGRSTSWRCRRTPPMTYFQRLHAIDITTGAELAVSPKLVEASVAGTGAGSAAGTRAVRSEAIRGTRRAAAVERRRRTRRGRRTATSLPTRAGLSATTRRRWRSAACST